jgi:hypothetical protein
MDAQDGNYDYSRPWQLMAEDIADDRIGNNNGPSWSPPVTPVLNPYQMIPPTYGYRTQELTIYDVLDNVCSRLQGSTIQGTPSDDWSGQQGGYEGTARPVGPGGGGVT